MTFDDIQKANQTIKTTNIKGKEYAEVNQRIKAFRMLYPDGFIKTEMLSNDNGVCVFKAIVGFYDEHGVSRMLGNGYAYEREGSTFINSTSYIENCETSAIGRACATLGIGIDTSVASYEEVSNAMLNQNRPSERKATPKQIEVLKNADINHQEIYERYGVYSLEQLTMVDASKEISKLKGVR